jgi:hypothetical protein
LSDLPQQKIPRELCDGGDPPIFLCSHRKFLDGTDNKNSKTQGGMGQIRIIFLKTRRKEWMKEKEETFTYVEVPILVCSPSVGNALGLPPLCDPPAGEPTHMGTSPTTLQLGLSHS